MGRSWKPAALGCMVRAREARERAAARDALVERTRKLTGGTLTVSALLSGVFAGIAAAYAPGHLLHAKATVQPAASATRPRPPASTRTSTAIPPLPPPPGPGNLSAAPPAPAPAPAPVATQAPPVVVSGGS